MTTSMPSINNTQLAHPDEAVSADSLRERAYTELLRQRAVALGLLQDHGMSAFQFPDSQTQDIIEQMLEREVSTPEPDPQEQQRHYAANRHRYVIDQSLHARHILFAVTPGVNVQALANKAEGVLLSLTARDAAPDGFARAAAEYSNCPSSQQGGDLGWITPQECAPELAQAFFWDSAGMMPPGLHPRLVHSRFGLHIVEVLASNQGRQLTFEEVRERVAMTLQVQSRSTALRQYMMILAGEADVRGVEIEGADSPLVQG